MPIVSIDSIRYLITSGDEKLREDIASKIVSRVRRETNIVVDFSAFTRGHNNTLFLDALIDTLKKKKCGENITLSLAADEKVVLRK